MPIEAVAVDSQIKRSFYLVTGKPGSGRTQFTRSLAQDLDLFLIDFETLFTLTGRKADAGPMAHETLFESLNKIFSTPDILPPLRSVAFDGSLLVSADVVDFVLAQMKSSEFNPFLVELQISDGDLYWRRSHQLWDPVTGKLYNTLYTSLADNYLRSPQEIDDDDELPDGDEEDAQQQQQKQQQFLLNDQLCGQEGDVEPQFPEYNECWLTELDKYQIIKRQPQQTPASVADSPTGKPVDETDNKGSQPVEQVNGDDIDDEDLGEEDVDESEEIKQRRRLQLYRRVQRNEAIVARRQPIAMVKLDQATSRRLVKRPTDGKEMFAEEMRFYQQEVWNRLNDELSVDLLPEIKRPVIEATQSQDAMLYQFRYWLRTVGCRLDRGPVRPEVINTGDKDNFDALLQSLNRDQVDRVVPRVEASVFGTKCPVTFYENSILQEGKVDYAIQYKGFLYIFVSPTAMKKFSIDPETFLSREPKSALKIFCLVQPTGKDVASRLKKRFGLELIRALDIIKNTPALKDKTLLTLSAADIEEYFAFMKSKTDGWILDCFPLTQRQAKTLKAMAVLPTHVIIDSEKPDENDHPLVVEFKAICEVFSDSATVTVGHSAALESMEDLINGRLGSYTAKIVDLGPLTEDDYDVVGVFGPTRDYCPVSLLEQGLLRKGRKSMAVQYRNRTYLLASQSAKEIFKRYPDLYCNVEKSPPPPRMAFFGQPHSGSHTVIESLSPPKNVQIIDFKQFANDHFCNTRDLAFALPLQNALQKGEPFPVDILNELFAELYTIPEGFILYGFPRNSTDAKYILESQRFALDAIVRCNSPREKCIARDMRELRERNMPADEDAVNYQYSLLADLADEAQNTLDAADCAYFHVLDAEQPLSRILQAAHKQLNHLLENRSLMFSDRKVITKRIAADEMRRRDIVHVGEYGELCPVSGGVADGSGVGAVSGQGLISKQRLGNFCAVVDTKLYYCKSRDAAKQFVAHTASFLTQPQPLRLELPRICVLGPPRSGKSTLCRRLSLDYNIQYLTMAEVLAQAVEQWTDTELSVQLREQLLEGQAADDELSVRALQLVMNRAVCGSKGWVLEDFPQTEQQGRLMEQYGLTPTKIFELRLPVDQCVRRAAPIDSQQFRERSLRLEYRRAVFEQERFWAEELPALRSAYHELYGPLWVQIDATTSSLSVYRRLRNAIRENINRREQYHHHRSLNQAVLCYDVGLRESDIQDRLSDFGFFCPVKYQTDNEMVLVKDATRTVEYANRTYRLLGDQQMQAFIQNPRKFVESLQIPDVMPHRIEASAVDSTIIGSLEFLGYCPVSLKHKESSIDGVVPGDLSFIVEYDNRYYSLADEERLQRFIQCPWKFIDQQLPFRLPLAHRPLELPALPTVGYMEENMAGIVNKAILSLGKLRPKLPHRSASQSAVYYLYLYLKANNPKLSVEQRHQFTKRLDRLAGDSQLIHYLHRALCDFTDPREEKAEVQTKLQQFLNYRLDDGDPTPTDATESAAPVASKNTSGGNTIITTKKTAV